MTATSKKTSKTSKTAKKTATAGTSRADNHARTIRVVAKENPRRAGTAAYKFHEAMVKSATVGDYLKRFKDDKDRRDASLWLSAAARQGHIKVGKAA